MSLIVGLGNPGAQYEWTRHNLGFMLVDLLAHQAGTQIKRAECQALVGRAVIENTQVELVKPQTYMNLSGECVACLARKRAPFHPANSLVVISDDLALPFGQVRLRARGSSGGHNGLKSIIAKIKTEEFIRLRIGIKPQHPVGNTAAFVLEQFAIGARREVEDVLAHSATALCALFRSGIDTAMSHYN